MAYNDFWGDLLLFFYERRSLNPAPFYFKNLRSGFFNFSNNPAFWE
jgi:hypothetical protein